jgi:hypothetical protein
MANTISMTVPIIAGWLALSLWPAHKQRALADSQDHDSRQPIDIVASKVA